MATKTTNRKKTTASRTQVQKVVKKVVNVPVQEVFQTRPEVAETVAVPRNAVLLFVNGRETGQVDTTGQKLGEFVKSQAQRHGIRTFSVYMDGVKADTGDANKSLASISKIEIVAKDARGSN